MTLNLSTLPIGTRLRTRDGRSARLLATDLKSDWPIVVAMTVTESGEEHIFTYLPDGRYFADCDGDHESESEIVSVEGNTDLRPDMRMECLDEHGEVDATNGRWTCRGCAEAMPDVRRK